LTYWVNGDAKPPKPLGASGPRLYYTHAVTDPTHHPKRQIDRFTHNYATSKEFRLGIMHELKEV